VGGVGVSRNSWSVLQGGSACQPLSRLRPCTYAWAMRMLDCLEGADGRSEWWRSVTCCTVFRRPEHVAAASHRDADLPARPERPGRLVAKLVAPRSGAASHSRAERRGDGAPLHRRRIQRLGRRRAPGRPRFAAITTMAPSVRSRVRRRGAVVGTASGPSGPGGYWGRSEALRLPLDHEDALDRSRLSDDVEEASGAEASRRPSSIFSPELAGAVRDRLAAQESPDSPSSCCCSEWVPVHGSPLVDSHLAATRFICTQASRRERSGVRRPVALGSAAAPQGLLTRGLRGTPGHHALPARSAPVTLPPAGLGPGGDRALLVTAA